MQGMFRRQSGVFFTRLVVPSRLRVLVGKIELIRSTGSRDLATAKVLAADILAGWRRCLLDLSQGAHVNLHQIAHGSPKLHLPGYLPLHEASLASGVDPVSLIRAAAERTIQLFVDPGRRPSFLVPLTDLERDQETGGRDIPPAHLMPPHAVATEYPGVMQLYGEDIPLLATNLVNGHECQLVAFESPGHPETACCPTGGLTVSQRNLLVRTDQIESLRAGLALGITPEHLAAARAQGRADAPAPKGHLRLTEALNDYMADRGRRCSADQARRVRAACDLFVELTGNPLIGAVDRAMLRHYRDKLLPTVPANENKVRLSHGSRTITESIDKVAESDWPKISDSEVAKRMQWLSGLFQWLHEEKWISDDPCIGLAQAIRPKKTAAANRARDLFTREELQTIFSAHWFRHGKGVLTRQGTYREFLPFYYWLPLLGLYYGARINELCQLNLKDIRTTATGTWYLDITEDGDEGDGDSLKRLKNVSSVRRVPLHPHLVTLGLLEWRSALVNAGHTRLFPELLHSDRKGHSAAAVKWFSGYLERLGWERTGKKVFHSFRHTLASECLNRLALSEPMTAQISGHARGTTMLGGTYRKDVVTDEFAPTVARLDFGLPRIAKFDVVEGLAALMHALGRKRTQK